MKVMLEKGNLSKEEIIKIVQKDFKVGAKSKKKRSYSIVGGKQVTTNIYPWFCYLVMEFSNGDRFSCGGTLIADNYVLSAAHCIYMTTTPVSIAVVPNTIDISNIGDTPVTYVKSFTGDGFNQQTLTKDIVLLELFPNEEINKLPKIKLNDIPVTELGNKTLTVTGFGATSFGGSSSNKLLDVDLQVVECAAQFDTPNTICAKAPNRDSCQGDSGGPLFMDDVQYGVVSYGYRCADTLPGVYTDVQKYRAFIEENVSGAVWVGKGGETTTTVDEQGVVTATVTSGVGSLIPGSSGETGSTLTILAVLLLIGLVIGAYFFLK